MKLFACLAVVALTGVTFSYHSKVLRDFKPAGLVEKKIEHYRIASYDPQTFELKLESSYTNKSQLEIASLSLRLVIERTDGSKVYTSPVQTISQFSENGSLLPHHKAGSQALRIAFPSKFWKADNVIKIEFIGGKAYGDPNRHQAVIPGGESTKDDLTLVSIKSEASAHSKAAQSSL